MANPTGKSESAIQRGASLRGRILAFVLSLILLSFLGSTISLYRITEVNRALDAINRVSVPLGRLFAQMQSDSEVFGRELEHGLGIAHWKDPHWRPRPIPGWIEDVLENEAARAAQLISTESEWAPPEARATWREWAQSISQGLANLRVDASRLYTALEQRDQATATELYPRWTASLEEWRRQLQWGLTEYDRTLRSSFSHAEKQASDLRTGLEMILIVVVLLSLLLLWLGERALRPLGELTKLAREITRRGLRKEDKALLPEIPLSRSDEVSQLAREFHRMATALLEREKALETQRNRVQEQNRLLREMGELNQNILNSIDSVLIVTDLYGKITQCNPNAVAWLAGAGARSNAVIGSNFTAWPRLQAFFPAFPSNERWIERGRLDPCAIEGRIFGGHVMPLRESGEAYGAIIVLDDLTEELDLQDRLRRAENLAAVGRMSAQVAHEVRNPLHSIGLEAEVAAETASKLGNPQLKQSLQSILGAVDRLEKITENYLKLSRLSSGERSEIDLGDILETVLATYAPACESQGVRVDWRREARARLRVHGDRDLLEQVFGNLLRNSLQALEGYAPRARFVPQISWSLGNAESGRVWLRIEDNGPGIPPEIRARLFTPFLTTRAQGTGLGLSFIKKVLEDHGGTISCAEREPGAGACFEAALPPASSALASAARAPDPEDIASGAGALAGTEVSQA